jgi:hypothetical protein
MLPPDRWGVIGRGKNGWHAEGLEVKYEHGSTKPSSSGGDLDGYLEDAVEGCLVYDADGASYDRFARLVISGPMVDPNLEPGSVSKCIQGAEDREALGRMIPGLGGGFRSLALAAFKDAGFSGLDTVGVDVYAALLRECGGVRVGWVRDGMVCWEQAEPLTLTADG